MLETIREYAQERLVARGEQEGLQRRHAACFLALAEEAEQAQWSAEQGTWFARLEREHDNIRAVLAWSARPNGDRETGLRLAGAVYRFWQVHGHLSEGRAWLGRLLALPDAGPASAARAKALFAAGHLAELQGDSGAGVRLLEASLALARALGDRRVQMFALDVLGVVRSRSSDPETVLSLADEGMRIARDLDFTPGVYWALWTMAQAARLQGDHDRARAHYEEMLALCRAQGDNWSTAFGLVGLGHLARLRHDYDRAGRLHAEALGLRLELGDRGGMATCFDALGRVASRLGHDERAARLFGAADALRETVGLVVADAYHARITAAARGRLGDAAFAAAREAGVRMALDDAVAYARQRLPGRAAPAGVDQGLSEREREVAVLIARGLGNREIADELVVSVRTVESHVASVRAKLDLTSRARIALWVHERGLMG